MRIQPLDPPYDPAIQESFDKVMPAGVSPLLLFRVLGRNPRVLGRVMRGGLLDRGTLTLGEREIMILRTTARCGSEYEWGVHVNAFAAKAHLTGEQVAATVKDDSSVWAPRELAIIRLADALHEESTVDDDLWTELRAHFSEEQLIELVVLAGSYHMISYVTNVFRIDLEADAARF